MKQTIEESELSAKNNLFELCQKTIREHKITCPESIYQVDANMFVCLELFEKICELVGYAKLEDEE